MILILILEAKHSRSRLEHSDRVVPIAVPVTHHCLGAGSTELIRDPCFAGLMLLRQVRETGLGIEYSHTMHIAWSRLLLARFTELAKSISRAVSTRWHHDVIDAIGGNLTAETAHRLGTIQVSIGLFLGNSIGARQQFLE